MAWDWKFSTSAGKNKRNIENLEFVVKMELEDGPPQSPNLNPIENLWSVLDGNEPPDRRSNRATFLNVLKEAWTNIDKDVLKSLVESMPRRLQAVIQAKGAHTKY